MPPFDGWYQGPENIVTLSKTHCPAEGAGDMRFVRITANGQPAAALYMLNRETGAHEEFQLHVLEIRAWRDIARGGVSRATDCSRSSDCPPPCSLEWPPMPPDRPEFAR